MGKNYFYGRGFNDKESALYKNAVRLLCELLNQEGVDMVTRAHAQATYLAYYDEFKAGYNRNHNDDIRPRGDAHVCFYRLIGQRCPKIHGDPFSDHSSGRVLDHASEWKRGNHTEMIVSHPYHVSLNDMKIVVSVCEKHGLDANIYGRPSWHFPGASMLFVVTTSEFSKTKGSK